MVQMILGFIVVLGITVTIHEFGHFAMAKLLGIRVMVFSLGFGPRLTGLRRGGTDYRISAFPLGGYVKMAGDAYDEERQGAPEEFLSHPRWHRFLVALAGPFMNILLAVGIFTVAFMDGVVVPKYPKGPALVGPVVENSIARRAGLQSGDRILSVQGNPVSTWEEMEIALAIAPKETLEVEVLRGSERHRIPLDPPAQGNADPFSLGFKYMIDQTVVAALDPDSPAQRAGLQVGDQIVRVEGNGAQGTRYDEILNIISASKGVPLEFEVKRGDSILKLGITPHESRGQVLIGFVPEIPTDFEKYGIGQAMVKAAGRCYEMSTLTFTIIGRIFTGTASVKTLSGPIEIARISGNAASTGSARVLFGLIALVSLQLGIFNLLPIPILDGGVIALLAIEGAMRRDLSLVLKERIVQVGFVFLILLMGFAVFNDLSKLVNLERLFR